MFQLMNRTAYMASLNTRMEKHGDKEVGAADIGIRIDMMGEMIDRLAPGLHSVLFKPDEEGDLAAQGEDRNTAVRFQEIAPFALKIALINQRVTIHHGVQGKHIVLEDCKVNDFKRIECLDGGTIRMQFRVQCYPTEAQVGMLFGKLRSEITVDMESELIDSQQTIQK